MLFQIKLVPTATARWLEKEKKSEEVEVGEEAGGGVGDEADPYAAADDTGGGRGGAAQQTAV